jgi:hypothetical protein
MTNSLARSGLRNGSAGLAFSSLRKSKYKPGSSPVAGQMPSNVQARHLDIAVRLGSSWRVDRIRFEYHAGAASEDRPDHIR